MSSNRKLVSSGVIARFSWKISIYSLLILLQISAHTAAEMELNRSCSSSSTEMSDCYMRFGETLNKTKQKITPTFLLAMRVQSGVPGVT